MRTILVVEDDPFNGKLLEKGLPKFGDFTVILEENVNNILELVRTGRIDLILLDIALANSIYMGQNVDGLFIAKLIRKIPQKGKLPIVLLTAYAMPGDNIKFIKESGANYYISKPLRNFSELVKIIDSFTVNTVKNKPDNI